MAPAQSSAASELNAARRLLTEGRLADAEQVLGRLKPVIAPHPLVHEYLGFIALHRNDPKKAVRHYRKAIKLKPSCPDLQAKLAEILLADGNEAEAVELSRRALRLDPGNIPALNLIGVSAGKAGRHQEARDCLKRAAETDPGRFETWHNLGSFHFGLGQTDEAVAALAKAHALHADHLPTLILLGRGYTAQGDPAAAIALLERAQRQAQSDASFCEATLFLAEALRRDRQHDKALAALRDIEARDRGNLKAALLRAMILEEQGDPEGALGMIRSLKDQGALAVADWFPNTLEPQCLLALGRHDEAADAFRLANERQKAAYDRIGADKNVFVRHINEAIDWAAGVGAADWPHGDGAGDGLAFINGFPRSGTTLIDAILRMHSRVAIAEEADAAFRCSQEAPTSGDPAAITAQQTDELRKYYRARLDPVLSSPATGRVIFDRHATGLLQAGLMKRLFPHARFFFMLRHPCDAVLSAWFRNFKPSHHTANYLTIEDTARIYDLMMRLYVTLEEKVGLHATVIRYEELVTDLRGTAEKILGEVGLDWEDSLEDFHRSANRPKRTASFSQVARPLYTDAVARFEHYRPTLEPVMPLLTPWIEHFGYEA